MDNKGMNKFLSVIRNGLVLSLVMILCVGIMGCGKIGSSKKDANEGTNEEQTVEGAESDSLIADASNENIIGENNGETKKDQSADECEADSSTENNTDFEMFAGEYCFSSGAGAWSTTITIQPDGTFKGQYSDSDMGDNGEKYPEGTVYFSQFEGRFDNLKQVDEFTYTTSVKCLEVTTNTNQEEYADDRKYVYTDSYGFTNPEELEFYLPGKKVSELSEDFLSWTGLRFRSIYPATLPFKAFYNVTDMAGFESLEVVPESNNELPKSKQLEPYELAGAYTSEIGAVMYISIYTDMDGGNEIGNISWKEDPDSMIYQPEAKLCSDKNGFVATPEYMESYSIIITDNTPGNIVFEVYDASGFDCGEYRMTEHFES